MILNTNSKEITINNILEFINIENDILYYYKKNNQNKYIKYKLDDINIFFDYMLYVNIPHVLEYENNVNIIYESNKYNIYDLYTKNIKSIKCGCIGPNYLVTDFIKKLNLNNIHLAEIGIRYSSTSKNIINELNDIIKQYDLFEHNIAYINYAKQLFNDNNKIKIYGNEADISLNNLPAEVIYDFVYFDASHKYDIDKKILNSLISHINKNSIILFDDYNIKDIYILVNDFVKQNICDTYIINNGEIIKLSNI